MIEVITKSKVKNVVPELNISSDVFDTLNEKVNQLLMDAAKRAKANGRRTLQAKDF